VSGGRETGVEMAGCSWSVWTIGEASGGSATGGRALGGEAVDDVGMRGKGFRATKGGYPR
jgi:hypothetical protein